MDDILNMQEDNPGGLAIIKFAPIWFFSTLNPITFNAGYNWINVFCTTETMNFSEQYMPDDNQGYQQIDITGTLPKIRSSIHATLAKYRGQQLILLCQDNNGQLRLAGTLDGGMILTDSSTTGAAVADANGYNLVFSGQMLQTALFL